MRAAFPSHALRTSLALLVAALLTAATCSAKAQDVSGQQDLSARRLTLVVAGSAGGASEAMARLLAHQLGERRSAQVNVEVDALSRSGDDFMPALRELAAAPPDGRTLLLMSTATLIAQSRHRDPAIDLTALTPVTEIAAGPLILTTRNSFPVNRLGDVIAYAKRDPHRLVLAAGAGAESAAYLAAQVLKAKAGIDVALVPYQGGGPALDQLLKSHVDLVLDAMTVIGPRVKAGILHPLAVTGAVRSEAEPEVETVMEAGVSDYAFEPCFGLLAPANTPPAIAKRLRDEVAGALAAPEIAAELERQGLRPLASEPEQWRADLKNELAHYATMINAAGIKPQEP
jgi:tripartite-type tricarboxylate transporter receptor subunit TctC